MSENAMYYLAIIGITAVALLLFYSLIVIKEAFCKLISTIKWKYRYKHRFDKKPLAKCYCKDCVYYFEEDERCAFGGIERRIPPDWFCEGATPDEWKS